jgi:hypothetical protein
MQFPVSRGDSILKASELPHNSLQKDGWFTAVCVELPTLIDARADRI